MNSKEHEGRLTACRRSGSCTMTKLSLCRFCSERKTPDWVSPEGRTLPDAMATHLCYRTRQRLQGQSMKAREKNKNRNKNWREREIERETGRVEEETKNVRELEEHSGHVRTSRDTHRLCYRELQQSLVQIRRHHS